MAVIATAIHPFDFMGTRILQGRENVRPVIAGPDVLAAKERSG
jgi:hypothetical protein